MSVIICGGPDPRSQKACYGGCYEWCFMGDICATPEADLTAEDVSRIRRLQRRGGGWYSNDLRTVPDFGLSPAMADMMCSRSFDSAGPTNRTARALMRRGLLDWWPNDFEAV